MAKSHRYSSSIGSGLQRDSERSRLFTRRLALLGMGKAALVSALVGRMHYLQVVEGDRYRMLADENRISMRLLPPPRGRLMDRFGVQLAVNQQNFRVMLVSEQARDVNATLDTLSHLVPLSEYDRTRVMREVARRRAFMPVTVRENLTWEEMALIQLNAPDLPGILIDEGLARHYPMGEEAAHVLGYVAAVSEDDLTGDPLLELPGFRIGKAGIEREYDLPLRGRSGSTQLEVNALGRVIRELSREEGQPGLDVHLTIDMRLQEVASQALADQSGSVVVMDVHNGEILAYASRPSFDPNAFNRGLSSREWRDLISNPKAPLTNKPISGQYAPGSTYKMVVALAALEAGVIAPEQTVFCPGHMSLGSARFHCWKRHGHGHMNMVNAISESCDVYFYEVARRVGVDRIADMAKRFGFGEVTGVGLPGERSGINPTRAWKQAAMGQPWHQGETLIAGIGQGYVLSTPMQLAVMTARIANGGIAVTPTVTRHAIEGGRLVPREASRFRSMNIPRNHLQIIQRGMWDVLNANNGTAWRHKLPADLGVEMAGKTGTAQVRRITRAERDAGVIRNEDLPWERRDHALFVAYAPYDEPRYALSVVIEHGGSGSSVGGPIAKQVMDACIRLDPARRDPRNEVAAAPAPAPEPPEETPRGQ